jgi:probable F420-dependent oxidoreductase
MCPPDRLVHLARMAEDAGWHGISLPESVFYPETVSAKYPFTSDGERFWAPDAPWVDPWVAIPALAASTDRVVFSTNVMKVTLRHPLLVAKTVGSAAALFPGRVELGVGLSWIPEEYAWLGEDMATRGRRLDEQIDVIRKVLAGGWVEHHGPHYDFGPLRVDPAPQVPVPIHVGGHSDAALARAARLGDGWIGAAAELDELRDLLDRLRKARDDAGDAAHRPGDAEFAIKATPLVPATAEAMAEVADLGVTEVITCPWFFYGGDPDDPSVQEEAVARFGVEVVRSFAHP